MESIARDKEEDRVMCFLKGLNNVYNTIKTQVLIMEPLPSVNRVFSLVLQQERQLAGGINNIVDNLEHKSTVNSFNNQSNWKQSGRGSNNWKGNGRGRGRNNSYGKQCTFCDKMNHTAKECYSKHGFPQWFKKKNKHSANNCFSNND